MEFPVELLVKCWFLAGPTACGKTNASLLLAERIGAEIVALDSMTLYRGMDIGTAKATMDDRERVPHHLVDILDPQDEYSLADYLQSAAEACQGIIDRGRVPLFVGGTGLYLRGILRGVFEGPAADWELRHRLEEQSLREGPLALHRQLQQVDAKTALRLHPNDQRRVIRALEVFELTGQPLSELQDQGPRPLNERPAHVYWISPPRDWLYHRIDVRVEQMIAAGLIEEVDRLRRRTQSFSHTARQALGYKEVLDWFETDALRGNFRSPEDSALRPSGKALGDLVELIQTRTRQFAKRQHTWFRNLEECRPIERSEVESDHDVVDLILKEA
ncbi:tRNA (adenosine(37)-N6)-dimethylallyltransferase MiaA [Schlesneria paludicola]|uniref:tRNA (adenosine(37)-N6)-dimethylallyltransferase MiaA n=1 Tax=Schlesneria paludicola TaxID=360056 RepID=UPI000299E17E|nr:tRNA (adenosine(37)-N6)-dimethylallyltransferase MiaA [Schlesneria paludicola]